MHNKQAGGIVSFVVVAVALTGLLAGGLYLSKQQGRVARDTDTSVPQTANVQKEENKAPAPAPRNENPAPTPSAPRSTPQPSTPAPTTPTVPVAPTNRVATTGPSDAIPETGPAETVAATVMLSALVFASYRHAQSRRGFYRAALHR